MKDGYYFGTVAKSLDVFAYPRTGSHFLHYAMTGLFDLVAVPNVYLPNREAIDRQLELDGRALYGLELREQGAPYCPLLLNALATGLHGIPQKGEDPCLLLIRDPIATAYSLYRVSSRWNSPITDAPKWLDAVLAGYEHFYNIGFSLVDQFPGEVLLVRYEALTNGPEALEDIVRFVGAKPKLRPDFVYWLTRFDRFVVPGNRSFYRQGRNDAWREDAEWVRLLSETAERDFSKFGYLKLPSCIANT